MSKKDTEWWEAGFFEAFRPAFGMITAMETNAQVRYLIKKLNLKQGSTFLDCPCGIGRVSIPLAKQGIRVTGIDITKQYITELDKKAKRAKLKINTSVGDMRRINYNSAFDSGGNLWTSFGFFEKRSDDILAIKKMFKALKPGGKFVLHVINRDWIIKNYSSNGWMEFGRVKTLEKRKFDYSTSINHGRWIYIKDGVEQATYDIFLRMYSYHELRAMFESVGFVDIEGFGSVKDEPITRDSRMMWIFGTKPKR